MKDKIMEILRENESCITTKIGEYLKSIDHPHTMVYGESYHDGERYYVQRDEYIDIVFFKTDKGIGFTEEKR